MAEQQRLRYDDIDAVVLKTVATILASFGIEEKDRQELRADFEALAQQHRTGAELYLQGRDHNCCHGFRRSSVARRQGHARQMIRASLVATILVFSEHAMPCWAGQVSWSAVESWARAKTVSDKDVEHAKRYVRQAAAGLKRWFRLYPIGLRC